jgi:hypothetical protein
VSCIPHWTLLILRDYTDLKFSTAINLNSEALHIFVFFRTFVVGRSLWGLPPSSSKVASNDAVSKHSTYRHASVIMDLDSGRAAAAGAGAGAGAAKAAVQQWRSSIEMLCNPTMHAAYSKYVERCLCYGELTRACILLISYHAIV